MARLHRRWRVLGVMMTSFISCAIYLVTSAFFNTDVELITTPSRQDRPMYPWDKRYAGPNAGEDEDEIRNVVNAADIGAEVKGQGPNKEERATYVKPVEKRNPVDFMTEQADVQTARRKRLQEACESWYPELSIGGIDLDTQTHMLVDEKHRLLYCFIPKVGCSNWKRVLMRLVGKTQKPLAAITSDEVHNDHGMRSLDTYDPEEQEYIVSTYAKFVYTRNPFARILSAYRNKYGDISVYRKETYFHQFSKFMIKTYRPNPDRRALDTGENATWTEFVMYLTDPAKNDFDDHWEEMYKLCSPCKIKYEFIGQLETVATDAEYMLRKLNLSGQVGYPSRKTSHPTNSTDNFENSFRELTVVQLERLWTIYETDFNLLGYPKPDFVPSSAGVES